MRRPAIPETAAAWPLVIGVDVARFGDDATVFFRRRGHIAFMPDVLRKLSNVDVAHRLMACIDEHRPALVCIDQGQGTGVIDLVRDLIRTPETSIVEVPFGSRALKPERFFNRRAEMWVAIRDWLRADLTAPTYDYDASGRLRLEAKDLIKERLRRSTDLADALAALTPDERQKLYAVLGVDTVAEIFSYLDDAEPYLKELPSEKAANVVSHMDSDDAVDALDDLEEEDKAKIVGQLDKDSAEDVKMLLSYGEDEIGSSMTTNYICIRKDMTIRQAMSELVKQAGENDNISTLYVVDENDKFYGAIDLKDLIIARAEDSLEKLIARSYPYVTDHEKISDCIDRIVDYAERSLPVLNDAGELVGIITSADVVELVDDEMGDDYAKLGGLTSEEDLNEGVFESVKKRLHWLIALLFLGMLVSSVVGAFESVVAVLPIVICFQSMVLDMAGNVGTQSLAVTIRVLVDENLTTSKKLHLLWKEMRVGLVNGALLAVMALGFLGCYIHFFKAYAWGQAFLLSGCVGVSLIVAMVISSLVGTVIPMLFHKIHIDPAVASGPLITTINDLVAVVVYYGLAMIVLIDMFHLG